MGYTFKDITPASTPGQPAIANILSLPSGTTFRSVSGNWYGCLLEQDGRPYIRISACPPSPEKAMDNACPILPLHPNGSENNIMLIDNVTLPAGQSSNDREIHVYAEIYDKFAFTAAAVSDPAIPVTSTDQITIIHGVPTLATNADATLALLDLIRKIMNCARNEAWQHINMTMDSGLVLAGIASSACATQLQTGPVSITLMYGSDKTPSVRILQDAARNAVKSMIEKSKNLHDAPTRQQIIDAFILRIAQDLHAKKTVEESKARNESGTYCPWTELDSQDQNTFIQLAADVHRILEDQCGWHVVFPTRQPNEPRVKLYTSLRRKNGTKFDIAVFENETIAGEKRTSAIGAAYCAKNAMPQPNGVSKTTWANTLEHIMLDMINMGAILIPPCKQEH